MSVEPDYKIAEKNLDKLLITNKISIKCTFVPFSRSRNKDEERLSLNWSVSVYKDDKCILTTDFTQGCAHTQAYKMPVKEVGHSNSIMRYEIMKKECEEGKFYGTGRNYTRVKEPSLTEVMYCLLIDSDVLNYSWFEEWAESCGYDKDSRSAEEIYRQCLKIALPLRNALGIIFDEALSYAQEM